MDAISSVKETPEFASLCSYIQLFGNDLNVSLSYSQLENYLEINDHENTPKQWIDIHRKLLGRLHVKCARDKWEISMNKFINGTLASETLLPDLYDKGYYSITAQHRARLLNIIFDCQFDKNVKFKEKVNQRPNKDLRVQPFGSDIYGCLYWFFVDAEVNIIMYKENLEDESFKIIAQSREDLGNLLDDLKRVDVDNVDLSKLYIESVTPDETNSPSNELDTLKDEVVDNQDGLNSPSTAVKVEELNSYRCIEMNGNKSPYLETKDVPINKVEEFTSLAIKNESNTNEISDTDTNLVISTLELQENKKEEVTKSNEGVDYIDKVQIINDLKVEEKKKRGRKPKFAKTKRKSLEGETNANDIISEPAEADTQESNLNLRRSERKRKPVNPFTILYTPVSTKKSKITDSQNDTTDLAESESNKKVKSKIKDREHSKRGRPKKAKKHSNRDKESKSEKKLKKKSKHQIKVHKKHKQRKPWEDAESSDEHVEEEEEEDMYQREESEASQNIKDEEIWNDKPESDFDPDNLSAASDEETLKSRGRNYFRQKNRLTKVEESETVDDKPCQICLSGNVPEMILLCDDCDYGHHAMCLRPSLMLIPEGDWYCPKCQHKKLIVNLSEKISELDKLLMKNVAKLRMQERLNFVNISMTNMLTSSRTHKPEPRSNVDYSHSDNGSSSPSLSSSSETDNSSDGSSTSDSDKATHGRYKFRESSRKENTRYNFEEIDKMFDNALENDEKYQFEKNRQENDESEESEPEYDYSGIEPRKKSSGKDMSNILEEEKPRLRRPPKRKRLMYGSDDGDFEDDEKDQDFKLSEESGSEVDEDDFRVSDNDVSDSDEQIGARTRRSSRKTHRRKEKKKKRRHVEYQDVASRPRRSAARKVNYLEMLGEDEDDDEEGHGDEEQPLHSPDFESSDNNDSSKPPPVLARKKGKLVNRRRKISDSEYEESKENTASESGSTEELENVKKDKKRRLCVESDTDSGRDENGGDGVVDQEVGRNRVVDQEVGRNGVVDQEVGRDGVVDQEVGRDGVVDQEVGRNGVVDQEVGRNGVEDSEDEGAMKLEDVGKVGKEESDGGNEVVEMNIEESDRTLVRDEDCVVPSLSMKNPMRAKDDQDVDVENEVESETDEDEDGSSLEVNDVNNGLTQTE